MMFIGVVYTIYSSSIGILLKRYTRFIWMCKFISVYTTGFGGVLFCLGSTVYGWYTLFIQVVASCCSFDYGVGTLGIQIKIFIWVSFSDF